MTLIQHSSLPSEKVSYDAPAAYIGEVRTGNNLNMEIKESWSKNLKLLLKPPWASEIYDPDSIFKILCSSIAPDAQSMQVWWELDKEELRYNTCSRPGLLRRGYSVCSLRLCLGGLKRNVENCKYVKQTKVILVCNMLWQVDYIFQKTMGHACLFSAIWKV